MKYRVAFIGSSDFAVPSLQALHRYVSVVCVLSHASKQFRKDPGNVVEESARSLGLRYRAISKINKVLIDFLCMLNLDFVVVVSSRFILNACVLSIPRYGCFNLHPSILPRWRGPSPIQCALLAGDTKTGVAIIKMTEEIDQGEIIVERFEPIYPYDNYLTLRRRLSYAGACLWYFFFESFHKRKNIQGRKQIGTPLYAHKMSRDKVIISWYNTASFIRKQVRAFYHNPGVFCSIPYRDSFFFIKVWNVELEDRHTSFPCGYVLDQNGSIQTMHGVIVLSCVQREGKRKMPFDLFNRPLFVRRDMLL